MNIWTQFVEILSEGIFLLAQLFGGNLALGIISISIVVRLALFPLTVYTSLKMREQNLLLAKMKPELDKLKKKFKKSPERLSQETLKLYKKHGYNPLSLLSSLASFIQLPIVMGLYNAIRQGLQSGGRFIWIKNIALPDPVLALIVAVLTVLSSLFAANAPEQSKSLAILLPGIITLFFAWRLAAGIGLYWAASSTISILQGLVLRRIKIK